MMLLIKLVLAHMVGDFMLQSNRWVRAKEERKLKAWQLYVHALVHGGLIMILVWDKAFLPWAALISLAHLIIDGTKLVLQEERTRRTWFFIDQLAHVVSLYLIFCWYQGYTEFDTSLLNEKNFLLATVVIFLTKPCSYIIKTVIAKWSPHNGTEAVESLENAGMYIGILERLFVFVSMITNNWEAIGFLLTAKSVFRFGDLKEANDRKLTEYILIGTLLSFGIAILAGMVYSASITK